MSSADSPARTLLAGLVDDAGLFPPTALAMPDALARHRRDQSADHPMHTHRFLCPASRLAELDVQLVADDRIRIGLIADTGLDGLPDALREIAANPHLELALIEFPLARAGIDDPGSAATTVAHKVTDLAGGRPLFLEPAAFGDTDAVARAVAEAAPEQPCGLKARCGGVRPELFPSAEALAHFLVAAHAASRPVKATAGLHHAVRYRDADTGFPHHGFLNLVLAVADVVAGADERATASTLLLDDGAALVARVRALPLDVAEAARTLFVAYGSCSTSTPIQEVHDLGLWPSPRTERG